MSKETHILDDKNVPAEVILSDDELDAVTGGGGDMGKQTGSSDPRMDRAGQDALRNYI